MCSLMSTRKQPKIHTPFVIHGHTHRHAKLTKHGEHVMCMICFHAFVKLSELHCIDMLVDISSIPSTIITTYTDTLQATVKPNYTNRVLSSVSHSESFKHTMSTKTLILMLKLLCFKHYSNSQVDI